MPEPVLAVGCCRVVARTDSSLCACTFFRVFIFIGLTDVCKVSEVGNEDKHFVNDLGVAFEQDEMFNGQEADIKCAIFTSNAASVPSNVITYKLQL